ncbi:aminoglycoside phosphotransferase family protein [Streptomyces sp. JV176]|nr:aminoglycoside phosphotransferase family protein [Streptomyces sp. JV176]MEE1800472.1 aminoglycoside phosphotransferase family protein [Streptomyces sp. JV176]
MIDIPEEFAETQSREGGAAGRAFLAALPSMAADLLARWELRVNGPSLTGRCALVLPVEDADGTPAMLKLQPVDDETAGEPVALRAWGGDGAVRLLRYDGTTGALLLERLRTGDLDALEPRAALPVIAGLLARLAATPAPPELRRLGDIAARMLDDTPALAATLPAGPGRRLLLDCAAAVREVAAEPGDRLLHWDLHFENVLAADREPWLAIDPKPLAGDPGFELMPALRNRFDPDDTLWRFDLMTETLGLDRARATAWTLGRVLQNLLWRLEEGDTELDPVQVSIARALLARGARRTAS